MEGRRPGHAPARAWAGRPQTRVLRWHFVKAGRLDEDRVALAALHLDGLEGDRRVRRRRRPRSSSAPAPAVKAALDVGAQVRRGHARSVLPFAQRQALRRRAGDLLRARRAAEDQRATSTCGRRRSADAWRRWLATKGPILTRLDVDRTWDERDGQRAATSTSTSRAPTRGGHAVALVGYTRRPLHRAQQLGHRLGRPRASPTPRWRTPRTRSRRRTGSRCEASSTARSSRSRAQRARARASQVARGRACSSAELPRPATARRLERHRLRQRPTAAQPLDGSGHGERAAADRRRSVRPRQPAVVADEVAVRTPTHGRYSAAATLHRPVRERYSLAVVGDQRRRRWPVRRGGQWRATHGHQRRSRQTCTAAMSRAATAPTPAMASRTFRAGSAAAGHGGADGERRRRRRRRG